MLHSDNWSRLGIPNADVIIVYDGECPVCSRLFTWYQRTQQRKPVALMDARKFPALYEELLADGIDLDQDFALFWSGGWYRGGLALGILFSEGNPNMLLRNTFRMACITVYPALRVGRRLLLRVLGRSLIGRDRESSPSRAPNKRGGSHS
jgi:hypothetical protein